MDTERCHEKRESRYMFRMARPAVDNPHANFLKGATHAAAHPAAPTATVNANTNSAISTSGNHAA